MGRDRGTAEGQGVGTGGGTGGGQGGDTHVSTCKTIMNKSKGGERHHEHDESNYDCTYIYKRYVCACLNV